MQQKIEWSTPESTSKKEQGYFGSQLRFDEARHLNGDKDQNKSPHYGLSPVWSYWDLQILYAFHSPGEAGEILKPCWISSQFFFFSPHPIISNKPQGPAG